MVMFLYNVHEHKDNLVSYCVLVSVILTHKQHERQVVTQRLFIYKIMNNKVAD